jgi:hypothetical protein
MEKKIKVSLLVAEKGFIPPECNIMLTNYNIRFYIIMQQDMPP